MTVLSSPSLLSLTLALLLCGCDGEAKPAPKSAQPAPDSREAQVLREVTEAVDGAHVRLVWVEQRSKDYDPFGRDDDYRLMGFDNKEGGFRVLSSRKDTYSRPMITPDGRQIVFTDRTHSGKAAAAADSEPMIKVLDWAGGEAKALAPGHGIELWRDPADGRTWVFGVTQHISKSKSHKVDQEVFRFPLDEPARREVVWQGTPMTIDNFDVSRDGRVFAALFPWPNAGVGEFATRRWKKLENGCWPAMAPDNSRVTWVFDGPHKRLRMFDAEGERIGVLDISEAPGVDRHATYHPRWANHPLYMVMTGPYPAKGKGASQLSRGARHAEIYLGRFRPDLRGFHQWVRLTYNNAGDFFPDAWIEGGEKEVLSEFPQHEGESVGRSAVAEWPRVDRGLQFAWNNFKSSNEVAGRGAASSLKAQGTARPGRFHDLLLDGGTFLADEESVRAFGEAARASGEFSLQFTLTERGEGPLPEGGVPLVTLGTASGSAILSIRRTASGLLTEVAAGAGASEGWRDEFSTDAFQTGRPVPVTVSFSDGRLTWFINGQPAHISKPLEGSPAWPDQPQFALGSDVRAWPHRWWRMEKVALASASRTPEEAAQEAALITAATADRHPLMRSRVRARLLSATAPEPERLDVYERQLIDHVYEVTEQLEGPALPEKKIAVLHWGILAEETVPGMPRQEGKTYELVLQPAADHPELESELTVTGDENFDLPLYYDLTPPSR